MFRILWQIFFLFFFFLDFHNPLFEMFFLYLPPVTMWSDVPLFPFTVIRAKVVGERVVDSGNDIYGNPIKRIQYDVKQIKVIMRYNFYLQ